ncbi:translation elongation factor Ts [soil metagenome]
MAEFNASMIKELRERTQAGMSDCKNALVEAGGDMEKAVEVILKKGIVKAAARAGKIAAEGEVRTLVSGNRGTIIEVNCQTDFVSRGDAFREFVGKVLEVASKLDEGADIGAQKYPGTDQPIETVRAEMVAKTGENTVIRRWDMLVCKEAGGLIHSYIHAGGRLAVLVEAHAPSDAAAKNPKFVDFVDNVAMQIAAMSPIVVSKDKVQKGDVDKQREIFQAQMQEEKTAGTLKAPEAAWPKILDGKLEKWFTEITLLGQDSVTTPGSSVDKVRQELGKELGGDVVISKFLRFGVGDGIEKVKDDLAEEVAKMTGG